VRLDDRQVEEHTRRHLFNVLGGGQVLVVHKLSFCFQKGGREGFRIA
jgi:hypothetical protein